MSTLDELYQQVIIDHSRSPRHFGKPERHTHTAEGDNPLCGDHYEVFVDLDERGVIRDLRFEGSGCAISKASASLMSDALIGQSREEVELVFHRFQALVKGELAEDEQQPLGKLRAFAGVWKFPSRVKCAILCWHALHGALAGGAVVSTE